MKDPKYLMFCADGDYLPASDAAVICDEIDSRLFLMEACILIVNENFNREEVEQMIPHMLDILDSQQKSPLVAKPEMQPNAEQD